MTVYVKICFWPETFQAKQLAVIKIPWMLFEAYEFKNKSNLEFDVAINMN